MRPVDADDAIHQIDMEKDGYNIAFLLQDDSYTSGAFDALDRAISVLEAIPTLDAVPVVRCKDCKYYKTESGECPANNGDDPYYSWIPKPDWYCAEGKRKEDA